MRSRYRLLLGLCRAAPRGRAGDTAAHTPCPTSSHGRSIDRGYPASWLIQFSSSVASASSSAATAGATAAGPRAHLHARQRHGHPGHPQYALAPSHPDPAPRADPALRGRWPSAPGASTARWPRVPLCFGSHLNCACTVAAEGTHGFTIRPPITSAAFTQVTCMVSKSSTHGSISTGAVSHHVGRDPSVAASSAPPTQRASVHSLQSEAAPLLESLSQRRRSAGAASESGTALYQASGNSGARRVPVPSVSGTWVAGLGADGSGSTAAGDAQQTPGSGSYAGLSSHADVSVSGSRPSWAGAGPQPAASAGSWVAGMRSGLQPRSVDANAASAFAGRASTSSSQSSALNSVCTPASTDGRGTTSGSAVNVDRRSNNWAYGGNNWLVGPMGGLDLGGPFF